MVKQPNKPTERELALKMIKAYWHCKAANEYFKVLKEQKQRIHFPELVESIKQASAKNSWFCKLLAQVLRSEGIGEHVFENEDEFIFQAMDEMDKKMEELTI